jgi:hypothetical protein
MAVVQLFLAAAALRSGYDPFDLTTYDRWDSGHYRSIAREPYLIYKLAPGDPFYYPGEWMGTTAWFPGYPYLARPGLWMGASDFAACLAVSLVFRFLGLALVWNVYLGARPRLRHFLCLALFGFFPGNVYHHAIFPVSTLCFASLASLWFVGRRAWGRAAAAAFAAAVVYTTGFLLAPLVGTWTLLGLLTDPPLAAAEHIRRLVRAAAYGLASAAGVLLVFAIQYHDVGRWDAFFLVQARYAPGIYNPVSIWLGHTRRLTASANPTARLLGVQCYLIAAFVIGSAAAAGRWRRMVATDQLLVLYGVVYFLFPLSQGPNVSLWRSAAVLAPIAILARHLHPAVQCILLAVMVAVDAAMAHAFFTGAAK